MGIDASAVASGLGVDLEHKNLRENSILNVPQRIMVPAQGASASSYSTDKFRAFSHTEVGEKLGWGSPAHLAAMELLPANGDGVGTIPVTFYPLEDDPAGVAASGDLTPSGTATKATSHRLRISGKLSAQYAVDEGALDAAGISELLGRIGDAVEAVIWMPVEVDYTYGTVTATPDGSNTGDGTVDSLSVTGSPRPGNWTLTCTAESPDDGTFQLTDPNGTVVADDLNVGAQDVGGVGFTINDGAEDYDVGDSFTITVPATKIDFDSKWKGASANGIKVEVLGESVGISYAITQPTGGSGNPSLSGALDQVGNVWETLGLNPMNPDDTTTLDALQTFGDGKWNEQVPHPVIFFVGNNAVTPAEATATTSGRRDDQVNGQLVAPGSPNLPLQIAARQLARIARVAQNNPAKGYVGQKADGIVAGKDSEQWTYAQRDAAIKLGTSVVEVADGVVYLGDICTMYRPAGEEPPAYRFAVNIVKLMQASYNFELEFSAEEWAAAPLIPDGTPTVEPTAKTPSMAKGAAASIVDALGLAAVIADPKIAKKNIAAVIDEGNPDRLNLTITFRLSGNTRIKAVTIKWGFNFGQALAA